VRMGWHDRPMHKLALVVVGGAVASAAPAAKSKQVILFDVPTASGSLAVNALEGVVKKAQPKLLACFTKVTSDGVDATVTFTIASDGKVTTAETTGPSDDIAACVTAAFMKLEFAASKETTGVVYPLAFARLYPPQPLGSNPITAAGGGGAFASLTGSGDAGFDDSNIYGGLFGNEARGGTGAGYAAGTHAVPPLVSLGQLTVTGDLGKAIIRRYVKRSIQKLQYCYEKELLVTKSLKGTVTAELTITPNGTVGTATASGIKNKNVESCVAAVIKDIEFPKPKGDVTVTYPMTFTPPPPPAKKTK
jgi:hypothetical protein